MCSQGCGLVCMGCGLVCMLCSRVWSIGSGFYAWNCRLIAVVCQCLQTKFWGVLYWSLSYGIMNSGFWSNWLLRLGLVAAIISLTLGCNCFYWAHSIVAFLQNHDSVIPLQSKLSSLATKGTDYQCLQVHWRRNRGGGGGGGGTGPLNFGQNFVEDCWRNMPAQQNFMYGMLSRSKNFRAPHGIRKGAHPLYRTSRGKPASLCPPPPPPHNKSSSYAYEVYWFFSIRGKILKDYPKILKNEALK